MQGEKNHIAIFSIGFFPCSGSEFFLCESSFCREDCSVPEPPPGHLFPLPVVRIVPKWSILSLRGGLSYPTLPSASTK